MKRLLKEPLLHFLLASALIFGGYELIHAGSGQTDKVIVVDRPGLLNYLQYRNRKFDPGQSDKLLEAMPPEQLQKLVGDYVREEAFYREAKAMALDRSDYVARLRLVQQFEYLTRGGLAEDFEVTDAELQAYFEKHKDQYYVEPTLTLSHVFIDKKRRPAAEALKYAESIGRELRKRPVDLASLGSYGDRFLYQVNYMDRDRRELASHFGRKMADQLFKLEANDSYWQGPLESDHGYHFVLLIKKGGGYQPRLDEVRDRVKEDCRRQVLQQRYEAALREVLDRYEIDNRLIPKAEGSRS